MIGPSTSAIAVRSLETNDRKSSGSSRQVDVWDLAASCRPIVDLVRVGIGRRHVNGRYCVKDLKARGYWMKGLIAAPHTPFDSDGGLWHDAIVRQANNFESRPVTGVFVGGSTGESPSLTMAERKSLCDVWSKLGRECKLHVIFHVGSNCLPDAIELAEHAGRQHVDAIAAHAPHYFRPQDVKDLLAFLRPIAAAAPDLPFFFYDIPLLTHVEFSLVDLLEQARELIPSFAGIKYTNNDIVQLKNCIERFGQEFTFLYGCDELLLAGCAAGVHGAVGSTYNFASEWCHRMIEAFEQDSHDEAREMQAVCVQMIERLADNGFLSASKSVMKFIGVDCGTTRLPIRPLRQDEESELFDDLQMLGCLDQRYQPIHS